MTKWLMCSIALLCLTSCESAEQPQAQSDVVVIERATIIDGVSGTSIQDGVMLIEASTIRAVGPRGSVDIPANARQIDATGKTIMPGMFNLHGHLGERDGMESSQNNYNRARVQRDLNAYLYYGVTHMVSLGRDQDLIFPLREDQRAGRVGGARVYTAYRGFSAPRGWQGDVPGLNRPTNPDEARELVRKVIAKNPDVIKIWVDDGLGTLPKLAPEVYGAIIDEAHKNGKKVLAHIFSLDDAKEMIRRGADGLAHIAQDREVDDEFLTLAKENRITQAPSLVRQQASSAYADGPDFLDDPGLPLLFPAVVLQTVGGKEYQENLAKNSVTARGRKSYDISAKNAKKVLDAGIPLAIGTDSGSAGRFQGLWEHREMELLVKAGLTPMQAIQAATLNGAKVLGVDHQYGSLTAGKVADFIVLSASPLDDIRNSRKIDSVWMNGKLVDRAALTTNAELSATR